MTYADKHCLRFHLYYTLPASVSRYCCTLCHNTSSCPPQSGRRCLPTPYQIEGRTQGMRWGEWCPLIGNSFGLDPGLLHFGSCTIITLNFTMLNIIIININILEDRRIGCILPMYVGCSINTWTKKPHIHQPTHSFKPLPQTPCFTPAETSHTLVYIIVSPVSFKESYSIFTTHYQNRIINSLYSKFVKTT